MKKTVSVEKEFCDICGAEAGYNHCLSCGKAFCYKCLKLEAKEYNHGVNFGGTGDGLYCLDCDAKLRVSGDKLHAAYRKIESLRNESRGWYEEFDKRKKEAEASLAELLKK